MNNGMHQARRSQMEVCPVCGAEAAERCRQATIRRTPTDPRDSEQGLAEWLEFTILRDSRKLSELNPEHWLAVAIAAACSERS